MTTPDWTELVDRLLAWATPDRKHVKEQITKVVNQHGAWGFESPDSTHATRYSTAQGDELIDALTDAVCGTNNPKWCEHWLYLGTSWRCQIPSTEGQQIFAMEDMKFCSWCGKPRPSQP